MGDKPVFIHSSGGFQQITVQAETGNPAWTVLRPARFLTRLITTLRENGLLFKLCVPEALASNNVVNCLFSVYKRVKDILSSYSVKLWASNASIGSAPEE